MYGLDISSGMEDPSKFIHAFYGGFHRAAWALALGWLIFACTRGYGGEWMQLQGMQIKSSSQLSGLKKRFDHRNKYIFDT